MKNFAKVVGFIFCTALISHAARAQDPPDVVAKEFLSRAGSTGTVREVPWDLVQGGRQFDTSRGDILRMIAGDVCLWFNADPLALARADAAGGARVQDEAEAWVIAEGWLQQMEQKPMARKTCLPRVHDGKTADGYACTFADDVNGYRSSGGNYQLVMINAHTGAIESFSGANRYIYDPATIKITAEQAQTLAGNRVTSVLGKPVVVLGAEDPHYQQLAARLEFGESDAIPLDHMRLAYGVLFSVGRWHGQADVDCETGKVLRGGMLLGSGPVPPLPHPGIGRVDPKRSLTASGAIWGGGLGFLTLGVWLWSRRRRVV